MPVAITIPSPGESINEVVLGTWHKSEGDWVEKDEPLVEIESDKATLDLPAPESGVLHIKAQPGDELKVGATIGSIDEKAKQPADSGPSGGGDTKRESAKPQAAVEAKASQNETAVTPATADRGQAAVAAENAQSRATSVAKKIAEERGIDLANVHGTGPSGRVTKSDVLGATPVSKSTVAQPITPVRSERGVRRERMSTLRKRIAERLVMAQHNAAMLTTFNEADMSAVMTLRKRYKDEFLENYGVNLGFMSFFVKACVSALLHFERVNAYIVGGEFEYHDFCDVSVAVGTDKGLVVPVIRDAQKLSFSDIEATIKDFALRAKEGKLAIDEMTGGTFTISNGGVYGSLNSTPILNPPQSGILGMHKIMNRPIENPDKPGEIVLRPMMYLALSYDHRIVDGAEAVGFLVHVKNAIEHPERLLLGV